MSAGMFQRDKQTGIEMGWHKSTDVVETVTRERAFPYQIILAQLAFESEIGESENEHHNFRHHGKWALPIASDDGLPVGNETPVNTETYSLQTPQMCWDYKDKVLAGTGHQVASAGTVHNRGKFYISTKLNEIEELELEDGSAIQLYFNIMGSLDKTMKFKLCKSTTRIVCQNTLMADFMATNKDLNIVLKHTKNMNREVEASLTLAEEAVGYSQIVKQTFNNLINTPCNKDRANRIYTGFLVNEIEKTTKTKVEEISTKLQTQIDEHTECFYTGDGNNGETEFDLLNGFTQLRTRGFESSEKDDWKIFESSEFGTYGQQKVRFAELLTTKRENLSEIEEKGMELVG
jgi:hypothetical protein